MLFRRKKNRIRAEKPKILPERKPPKEQWHPWRLNGKLSKPAPAIREYAKQFPGKDVATVEKIISDLLRFEKISVSQKELAKTYGMRTADNIVEERKVYIAQEEDIKNHSPAVQGCLDYCNVLATVLRYKGIPAVFARLQNHSTVHFMHEGRTYVADPTFNKIAPLEGRTRITYEKAKKLGLAAEGPDSLSIGINTIGDYNKYARNHLHQ